MKRNSYRSDSWLEWIMTWSFILIGIPAGLAFSGLFIKVLFNCFMTGWSLL
jgi:hypothetical protein